MKYMRITAGYAWTDYTTDTEIAKQLNITAVLSKIQEYRRNWLQHINKKIRNRLPGIRRKLQTNSYKKPGAHIKETSRCVRPERVHKWLNSMLAP
jgi:hypothetical protein